MPGYKHPNIDSGATLIGNTGRAPDKKEKFEKEFDKKKKKKRRRNWSL
jgi:hypothetical protein